jgi:hypothetical protein
VSPSDQPDRRRFLRASLGVVATGLAGWFGWLRWSSESRQLPTEYRAALGELIELDLAGVEIQLIGKDYLNSQGSPPAVVQLLADISGIDRARFARAEPDLASRFRLAVSRRIATELDSGELVQLHGYFVAPTFGRLCAAIVLVVQA